MQYKNYESLGITSAKKPPNTHLIIENSNAHLFIVDSADLSTIIKSEDKGASWGAALADHGVSDITAFWHERSSGRLYYAYFVLASFHIHVDYIDFSDDSDNTTWNIGIGTTDPHVLTDVVFANAQTYAYAYYTHDFLGDGWSAILRSLRSGGTSDITIESGLGGDPLNSIDLSWVTIAGGSEYMLYQTSTDHVFIMAKNSTTQNWTNLEDCGANLNLPTKNQQGIAYDGFNILSFVLQDTGDSKFYLYIYEIDSDTLTKRGEYNIVLMLDRNTAAGVLEKAFHITEPKIFQINIKQTNQLYLIAILKTNDPIVAITDNFVLTWT